MPAISLPDGSVRDFDGPVSGAELAADIGPGLAKAALAIEIGGALSDLDLPIEQDVTVRIITSRDDEALELIRHDCAHVMAEAVQELYPEVQVTIGPSIENGFYYDFHRAEPFTPDDLETIEKRMHDIVDRAEPITRELWSREQAVLHYKKVHEPFKVELVEAIPENETVSFYRQGGFLDLCRGPHMPTTKYVGHAFKLMNVAGAYWRGDSNRPMLQRIYGTAWTNQKEL
ncbi:MAG: TGS domain-containing protein, partial [Rhodospirillaceae bacterium]|nr:TGS domain-containing protein [Rhodospirillaceae bacterium]